MSNKEIPEFLMEMSKRMNTDDNRCTSHPFWQVRCKRYLITEEGYNESHWELIRDDGEGIPEYSSLPGYDNVAAFEDFEADNKKWCAEWIEENVDSELIGEDSAFTDFFDVEAHKHSGEDWPECYKIVHFQEIEEVVSTHLTEDGARRFINRKQHDYPALYTYVESAYWSPELRQLQDWVKSLTAKVGE